MASKQLAKGLKRSALTVALGLCFASGVQAQSSTTGTIYGDGAQPGTTVVIQNAATGLTREITVGANGRYSASSLPAGQYKVMLQRDGQTIATRENVNVQIGSGNEVSFGASSDATTLGTVMVVGSANQSPIDVSQTDTRVVLTAEQLQKIPVAKDITSVALLTPGVVAADSRYGNTASFGGSAASENAIYINGYAVTNPLTNLGSTTLPFDAVDQFQSIIGGYGAEFGRATGGVINMLTKRGTNDWKFGAMVTLAPASLRAKQKSLYFPHVGRPTDGRLLQNLAEREEQTTTYGAYASGPIVQDRLFFYAGAEFTEQDVKTVGFYNASPATNYSVIGTQSPRWIGKLDWRINDDNLLEFTAIQDKTKRTDHYFSYDYNTLTHGNTENGGYYYEDGGKLYIAKYTGYLTDNLTLTALVGKQDQVHIALPGGYDPNAVYVSDGRNAPGTPITGVQPYLYIRNPNANDATKGGRLDVEWLLGDHDIRVGYDRQESISTAGTNMSGPGYAWFYAHTDQPNDPIPSGGGAVGPGGNGDYVSKYIFENGGTFKVLQEAQYIQDRWQINDNWLLSLGLRNEQFSNYNADGIVYVAQRHQLAPRIGVSWDVHGDSTLKVFANLGRYHLAMPNNVALRGAAGSLYTNEYFSYTGVDANGVPTGLTPLGNGPFSVNNEYGQAPDPNSVAAAGLKSHYQDEFIIGMEKQLTEGLSFGARLVHRDLKSAIDDICDGRPAREWALANGYSADVADNLDASLGGCRLFNPGEANTFNLDDGSGNLITVPLTAADLGMPKLKRKYLGLDTYLEHPFDGTWYYRIDYTLSKNYGNAEGQLNSDIGQQDVSQTTDWDQPELMAYSNGYLPNDRRHFLKAHGYYQMTPEWRFSAALSAASGRPKTCHGFYSRPNAGDEFYNQYEYGPYYHVCGNQPAPRGTAGRLPWTTRLDLGVNYNPAFADHKVQFMLDVFNVFNSQVTQNVFELSEAGVNDQGTQFTPHGSYGRTISYSAPRSVRFGVRYDF